MEADATADPHAEELQYEKVNLRGLDDLVTDDIKQFASDHFKLEEPLRLEWIDDTSANIIYSSPEVGLQALSAFTQPGTEEDASSLPAVRLRSAKILSTHPDSVLQVRTATKADRKRPRAYEASRFYLMHPEHDPREKLRREISERGQDYSSDDYRRRGFDQREHRRRRDRDHEIGFSADMYDDDAASYRPSRTRNRSTSPNDYGEGSSRFRERSPPHYFRRNEGKELFPASPAATSTGRRVGGRELLPERLAAGANRGKELFPSKASSSHRRTDAFDAADDTARIPVKLFGESIDKGNDGNPRRQDNSNTELFPQSSAGPDNNTREEGISIRGKALTQGISIKGRGSSSEELFMSNPDADGSGQLFSEKLWGRGGRRRRAEDMFY